MLPLFTSCSIVLVPSQLLVNHTPPDLFHTVIAILSLFPGSPISVIFTCRVALPSIDCGRRGFVISWILALPLSTAVLGHAVFILSDVIELPFTWYTRKTPDSILLKMLLILPCRFVWLLLYFTLKPKLFLVPGSPAFMPAEFVNTRYPPPVMNRSASGFAIVMTASSSELLRQ